MDTDEKYLINVDVFEPDYMRMQLASQLTVLSKHMAGKGLGDYMWISHRGRHIVERKQPAEALAEIQGMLDNQLRAYIERRTAEHERVEITLLIEGMATPLGSNKTQIWGISKAKTVMYRKQVINRPLARLYSYLADLRMYGVQAIFCPDIQASAHAIISMVKHSHEPCDALETYPSPTFNPDPHIQLLLGIKGIGEKKAQEVLDQFGTPIKAFRANPATLEKKLGKNVTKLLLRGCGRA